MSKTVREYLAEVDYTALNTYKPSEFAIGFINFIKLVNGSQGEENKTPVVHYKMLDGLVSDKTQIANMCARGMSKALCIKTPIMTPNGYIPMEDIVVGDTVIDRDGLPCRVTHISELFYNQTYVITLADGSSFIANEDHLHIVQRRTQTRKRKNIWKEQVLTTREILDGGVTYSRKVNAKQPKGKESKWFIPLVSKAIEWDSKQPLVEPYFIGLILGDGSIDKTSVMLTSHKDDIDEILSYVPYQHGAIGFDKRNINTCFTRFRDINKAVLSMVGNVSKEYKFIPNELLFGSIDERIAVLQGLMDTDGTINDTGYSSYTTISKSLAYGVSHIVKSLGGYARVSKHSNAYKGYYNVSIHLDNINPFRLKRKANKWKPNKKYLSGRRVAITSIEPTDSIVPSKCISVDSPTKSYLIDNAVVTHNTTLLGEYFILYLAVFGELPKFGKVELMLYVTDSIDNGVKSMRKNLEYRLENSEFLQHYITQTKFTDIRWEFTNKDGNVFVVKAYGAKSGVRGVKEQGKRPSIALLDDLVSDDDARSPTVLESIKATVHEAVINALHPKKQKIIWLGTPFNANDPLYEAIESGAWYVNVYPVCEKFPCSREEFKGAWEDRFDYDYIKLRYESALAVGRVNGFYQELMLQIMNDDERLILDEDIQWYSLPNLLENKSNFNFYITTDFATSEKTSADYSFISVWAVNHKGYYFWVDGICARQLMDKNIDDLFHLVSKYNPISVGIETTGQQGGFISWINREMFSRNIFFSLASQSNNTTQGIRPTTDKLSRFNVVVPDFKTKRFYFPIEKKHTIALKEMLLELEQATIGGFRSKHDDALDTISMLSAMQIWLPSNEVVMTKTNGIWDTDESNSVSSVSSYIV